MRVLIVGVNHQIQPAQIENMSTDGSAEAFERTQKETFGQMLRTIIHEHGIQFAGEEARQGDDTVAQRVCALEDCRYVNLDMAPPERELRKIPPGYRDEGSKLSEAEIARCDREREEHMFRRALAETGDADSILIICGSLHVDALAAHFRQSGHALETTDLQDQDWYVEDWAAHIIHNL